MSVDRRSDGGITKRTGSSFRKLRSVGLGGVRWTEGFWADRFRLCHNTIIPSMRKALENPENAAFLGNFDVAAGLREGEHRGTKWSDGDCYKWMEAVAHVYGITGDEELDRQLDALIDVISKAQDEDGYISTQIQLTERKRWAELQNHELYNMGHLMTAASAHYRATHKRSFLDVAKKLGDYLYEVFAPRPAELAHFGFNPSNIMGAVDLYHATGDEKYLDLAGIFIDMRGSQPGGSDQNQDRVPLRKETEAVGHAVTAAYLYCGAADVYAETGDPSLWDALRRIWEDVVTRKTYVTGGIGPLHQGVSIRRDQVHEAFARGYELPNSTAYNETCANIGNAMWNWRMLAISGDAKYADVMEQVIYNSGLSPMSSDGKRFRYTNPLRWYGEEHRLLSNDTPSRWETFHCYCCPPQVARTIARMHEWAYSMSDEGLWVHLYGGNVLETQLPDGGELKLRQETEYPWDGHVALAIEEAPARDLTILMRIPGWAESAEIRVNGEIVATAELGTYAEIRRAWGAGDRIELDLPMPARMLHAHPKVEEARNQVAIMRGPIVYCLESPDLPEGVPLSEVHIPRDVALTARHDEDVLGGVTVLEGEATRIREGDWTGKLYREIGEEAPEPVRIALIPYYAWANRGVSEMTVWMPLA